MNKRCEKCDYYCIGTETCDHLLRTGVRRGCPIDGCTRFKHTGEKKLDRFQLPTSPLLKKKIPVEKKPKAPTAKQLRQHKMRDLYEEGKNDREIAKEVGRTSSAVGAWRKKNDLPRLAFGRPRKEA